MLPMSKLLEQASRVARRVPTPTELDHFAEYVKNEAVITHVMALSVTAEGAESTRTYEPKGGLTEGDYHRLSYDDLSREALPGGWSRTCLDARDSPGRRSLTPSDRFLMRRCPC